MPNSLCGSQLEEGRNDTQLVLWIVVGGIAGLLADAVVRRISVGLVGAFVGGYFLSPLFNVSTINEGNFSIPALLVSLGGAVILLAISRLFRNIGGFLVILIIALIIYIYFNCWSMASTSAFCTTIRALPFLQ